MAEFTEIQIQMMITDLKDEFGPEIATRELALLELEDMKRKGCALEYACKFDQCYTCSKSDDCPVLTWEKRHPEYANDELAMRIKVLEAGGEEAYKEKMKHQEEAKKKAEEKKHAIEDAKQQLFHDLLMKKFVETPEDESKWIDKFEAHLEAYVQARINEKS